MKKTLQLLLLTGSLALLGGPVQAGLQIPYTNNPSTLHLWHLDGPDGLTTPDAVTTSPITLTNLGLPTAGTLPYTNVNLGVASFPGLGNCLRAPVNKQHVLYGGAFTDVSQFCNPVSGAFTFEAVVKFTGNPTAAGDYEIVSGDNGLGLGNRGWQWRIFNGVMEWDLLAGATSDDFKSTLPAIGPDAAVSNTWYHVAVTYTGNGPTNTDTPNLITFYWTLLDANRIGASQLGQFTASRPLNGAPLGTSEPGLGVGGSARNTTSNPGNNEGIIGSIDEVRISNVCLRSNQMAFVTGGALNPPTFTKEPPALTLAGYNQTLTVPALVSGTPPLSYQWLLNGTPIPGQTGTTLLIPNVTFAGGGNYTLFVTNAYGRATSSVAQVTIGAVATGLLDTGLDTTGALSAGDIADPNWTLFQSADPTYLGPTAEIFENSNPLQFASPNGAFAPTNSSSMWVGAIGNAGGVTINSPAGNYYYRSTFLIDQADPSTMKLSGNLWASGTISDILINGKSTGNAINPGGTLYVATWAVTNGFIPGVNTLDFVNNLTGAGITAVRVEVNSIGQALPPGLPLITNQPVSAVVRDSQVAPGSQASFSVVALGRPPLNYQWYADGSVLAGATARTLIFPNPTAGAQGSSFQVVVSNDSGAVTSRVATLTLVSSNQPPVAPTYSYVAFQNQNLTIPLSLLQQSSTDPDGDPVTYSYADFSSTNGAGNVNEVGASLVYTPVAGYVGPDQFSYYVIDNAGLTTQGYVNILALNSPTNQFIAPGGTAGFDLGLGSTPAGYTFQWQFNGTNLVGANGDSLTITNASTAQAGAYNVVIVDANHQVWPSPIAGLDVGIPGTGTGLMGDYYSNMTNGFGNFIGAPTLTRLDPTVNFNFGSAAPDPSISATYFMARWHGQVQPLYSGLYTFYTSSDDGSRLWVNGQLIVNQWQAQAQATRSGTINLAAGQKYDLVLEYFQVTGPDVIQLSWSSLNEVMEIIPTSQLYPSPSLPQPKLSATLGTPGNLVLNWAGTYNLQSATSLFGPWTTVSSSVIGPVTVSLGGGSQQYYRLANPVSP